MLIVVGKKRVCRLGDETEKERISNGKERQRRRTKERRGVNCVHKNVVAVVVFDTLSTRAWTNYSSPALENKSRFIYCRKGIFYMHSLCSFACSTPDPDTTADVSTTVSTCDDTNDASAPTPAPCLAKTACSAAYRNEGFCGRIGIVPRSGTRGKKVAWGR